MGKNRYMKRFVPALSETVKVSFERGGRIVANKGVELEPTKFSRLNFESFVSQIRKIFRGRGL